MAQDRNITQMLQQAAEGREGALDRLAELVYGDLERLAAARMRQQLGPSLDALTLEPAALVHETFLKLIRDRRDYADRRHFFAVANQVMVRVLLDYHRARNASKRGGGKIRVTLSGISDPNAREPGAEVPDLINALKQLESLDARKAEVVKLRGLWGLGMEEIARTIGVSLATVERDWRFSKSWLAAALSSG